MRAGFKNAAAAGLGTVLALAGAEVFVRLFVPQPAHRYRYSAATFYEPVPGASFRYRRSEFAQDITYNAFGMRDIERTLAKPAGTLRVALVGDSQTEAKEVPFDSTVARILERELQRRIPERRIEVLNFGVAGYGTVASWARFEHLGAQFGCDLVVYLFNDNDPSDVASGRDRRLYDVTGDSLSLRALPWDMGARLRAGALDWTKQHVQTYSFVKVAAARLASRGSAAASTAAVESGPEADAVWQRMRGAIAGLNRSVRRTGAGFVVAQGGTRGAAMSRDLARTCDALDVEYVDLVAAFAGTSEAVWYAHDGHWRTAGHRRAAPLLLTCAERRLRAVVDAAGGGRAQSGS